MAAADGPAHLLTLKVMRISRPDLTAAWQPFFSSSPSFSAHSSASILSLQGSTPLSGHPKTLRDLTSASEVLMLPASFGSIQLGETFSSCLCLNNETQVDIEATQVKVEMQTVSSKLVLYEMDGSGKTIHGGDTLEYIVHHEIKELGQHVLACAVTYRLPQNARPIAGASEDPSDPSLQTFRKFYKFAVTNPFSVKTKVHSAKSPTALFSPIEREKIFLEIHIQNLTQEAIYFERMRLECTDEWESADGNTLPSIDGEEQTSIFSGSMALMQPQDMRQYVYILMPKVKDLTPKIYAPGTIMPLGRLDIVWRSHFGEPGRLLTSMLSRRIAPPPSQVAAAVPPHLKKAIAGATLPRTHSSQSGSQPQSRPGTPGPVQRPSSPAVVGQSSTSSEAPPTFPLQELEVQLLVHHIPRDIVVEKPFSIAFSLVIWSTIPPGREHYKRKVSLAIQHIKRRKRPSLPPLQEPHTPHLPSGFSTPASAAGTFNYALAHQKILAASSQPPSETVVAESHGQSKTLRVFPPPFFEGCEEDPTKNVVSFVGPSVVFLPQFEIDYSNHTVLADKPPKVHHTQDFELTFASLRKGFSIVQGLRILLVDDQLVQDSEELDNIAGQRDKIEILKEYETLAEVWVVS